MPAPSRGWDCKAGASWNIYALCCQCPDDALPSASVLIIQLLRSYFHLRTCLMACTSCNRPKHVALNCSRWSFQGNAALGFSNKIRRARQGNALSLFDHAVLARLTATFALSMKPRWTDGLTQRDGSQRPAGAHQEGSKLLVHAPRTCNHAIDGVSVSRARMAGTRNC